MNARKIETMEDEKSISLHSNEACSKRDGTNLATYNLEWGKFWKIKRSEPVNMVREAKMFN